MNPPKISRRTETVFSIGKRLCAAMENGKPKPEKEQWFYRNKERFERALLNQHPFKNQSYVEFQSQTGRIRAL